MADLSEVPVGELMAEVRRRLECQDKPEKRLILVGEDPPSPLPPPLPPPVLALLRGSLAGRAPAPRPDLKRGAGGGERVSPAGSGRAAPLVGAPRPPRSGHSARPFLTRLPPPPPPPTLSPPPAPRAAPRAGDPLGNLGLLIP